MIRVLIPSPLHSYTRGASEISVEATTLDAVTHCLDEKFPGVRFRIIDERDRIRRHIQFFVNGEMVRALDGALQPGDTVQIVCALSGG